MWPKYISQSDELLASTRIDDRCCCFAREGLFRSILHSLPISLPCSMYNWLLTVLLLLLLLLLLLVMIEIGLMWHDKTSMYSFVSVNCMTIHSHLSLRVDHSVRVWSTSWIAANIWCCNLSSHRCVLLLFLLLQNAIIIANAVLVVCDEFNGHSLWSSRQFFFFSILLLHLALPLRLTLLHLFYCTCLFNFVATCLIG